MPEALATPTTPSAPTETPSPAAPATSAPSPSITPDQRPTMEEAFAADVAPTTPAVPTPPEGATTPPVETPAAESATPTTDQGPPIPLSVHRKALENRGIKAVEEFKAQSGVADAVQFAQRITTNAPGAWRQFTQELLAHPEHGPALRSDLARMFGGLRQGAAPKPVDLSPDVVVHDDQGREVARTFSAERMQAIVQQAVAQQVGPLQQERAQRQAQAERAQAERRAAETRQQLDAAADTVMADIGELLDITEATPKAQKDALYAELNTLLEAEPDLTPHKAAMQVRKTRIVPQLQGQAKKSVLESLHKQAGAAGLNPAGAVIAPTHRPRSLNDPSLKW